MRINMLLIPLFVIALVNSFQSNAADRATETPVNKAADQSLDKSLDKPPAKTDHNNYLYGYSKKEIHSIPRISVRGFDHPE